MFEVVRQGSFGGVSCGKEWYGVVWNGEVSIGQSRYVRAVMSCCGRVSTGAVSWGEMCSVKVWFFICLIKAKVLNGASQGKFNSSTKMENKLEKTLLVISWIIMTPFIVYGLYWSFLTIVDEFWPMFFGPRRT